MMDVIDNYYDIIVVGGGINGCAIARDASLRRLRVLLLEKGDFGSGASSKSSKLIHGGLRYLERGRLGLVRESLRERNGLLKNASHLVKPLPFVFPVYSGDKRPYWQVNLGLYLYDWLDHASPMAKHRALTEQDVTERFTSLKSEGLRGGFSYFDAQMNDSRLVIENVLDARQSGADLFNYTEATDFIKEEGKIVGVKFHSARRQLTGEVRAGIVVLAAGAWSNKVMEIAEPGAKPLVRPTKGAHIVVPKRDHDTALILSTPQDGRVFFVMPWGEVSLVGTTDTDYEGDLDSVSAETADVDYLLDATNHYFNNSPLTREDVIASFAGLRPLVASSHGSPSCLSRESRITVTPSGMVVVVGGKYTTFRQMAEDVVDIAGTRLGRSQEELRCHTASRPLPGGGFHDLSSDQISTAARDNAVSPEQIKHLLERYGSAYSAVLEICHKVPHGLQRICPHHLHLVGELAYAIAVEQAMTLEDWFFRRTWIGYSHTCNNRCLKHVSKMFAAMLGWDENKRSGEVKSYVQLYR